jgi:hypothetical protein
MLQTQQFRIKFCLIFLIVLSTISSLKAQIDLCDSTIRFDLTETFINESDQICQRIGICPIDDIVSFIFDVRFDNTMVEFAGCENLSSITSFSCNSVASVPILLDQGRLPVLWTSPNLVPTLVEGPLVDLCFTPVNPSSDPNVMVDVLPTTMLIEFIEFQNDEIESITDFCIVTAQDVEDAIRPIPTLGEWGLILLSLILLIVGLVYLKSDSMNSLNNTSIN